MFTTASALTEVLISQHSLTNSRCVLACCCSRLWSSFTHLAGFLQPKRMPRKCRFTQLHLARTSSPSASSQSCTKPLIVTALTRMMCSLSCVMSAGESKIFLPSGAVCGELRFQR